MAKRGGEAQESLREPKRKRAITLAQLKSHDDDDDSIDSVDSVGSTDLESDSVESGSEPLSDEEVGSDYESSVDDVPTMKDMNDSHTKPTGLSAEDIQIARETSELFKSNIFKLQIDELLSEVKLEEKHTRVLDNLLFKLNEQIKTIGEVDGLSLEEAEKLTASVGIPFADPKPRDIKYKFGWKRPVSVNVVGGYSFKTCVRTPDGVGIDIMVAMPQSLFSEKDYLNYRYFHKKAFYCAYLAKHLKKSSSSQDWFTVTYAFQSDDPLKPIVRLGLTSPKLAKRFHINILVSVEHGTFDCRKLDVKRNCIRFGTDTSVATTLYNSALISDMTYTPYLKMLFAASKKCENFVEACKLGGIWLRQRGFSSSPSKGGFGHFEWALLMAILLQGGMSKTRTLMNGFSSYQLFKNTVRFLATHDLSKSRGALTFNGGGSSSTNTPNATKSTSATDSATNIKTNEGFPLIYDQDNCLNILYKMSRWAYSSLKYEACVTSDLLNDVTKDRFDQIFLQPLKDHFRYDYTFRLLASCDDKSYTGLNKIQYLSPERYWVNRLYRMLDRGLGRRAKVIAFPQLIRKSNRLEITIGLIVDPEESDKVITFGPSAEDDENVKRFQSFWGAKSELRRFQDGSIRETVVWQNPYEVEGRRPVPFQIVDYLVSLHLPEVDVIFDKLPSFINKILKNGRQEHQYKYSAFQKAAQLLQELSTEIPLRVKSVYPASSSLRYTSISPPEPFNVDVQSGDDVIGSGIIEFETTNKWPDDTTALEQTKTAFLLKIAQEIAAKESRYDALIGTESDFLPGVETGFLQLLTPQGYEFKLRVVTEFDQTLLNRQLSSVNSTEGSSQKAKARLNDLLDTYKQRYQFSISHTRLIQSMALKFVHYSPFCRLLKLWFKRHMLTNFVNEETIELLALKPFVDSGPYAPPGSTTVALLRVLDFLASWDWRSDPLILDTGRTEANSSRGEENLGCLLSSVTGTQMNLGWYQKRNAAFKKERDADPAMTVAPLVIFSHIDPTGVSWTRQIPASESGRVAASRVTGLARAAMMLTKLDYAKIFTPSFEEYDFVIELTHHHNEHRFKSEFKNLDVESRLRFPETDEVVDKSVDVVEELYKDLQSRLKDSVLLFFGGSNTAHIGGIWHKDTSGLKKFKVNLGYSTIPVKEDSVKLNKDAVIEEIKRIGGDLIEDVVVNH